MALKQNNAEGSAHGTTLATSQSGSGDPFNAISPVGTPTYTYDNTQSMHGSQSYHVTGGSSDRVNIDFSSTSATASAFRVYIRFATLPSGAYDLFQIRNTAGSLNAGIGMSSLGRIQVKETTNTLHTFASSLSINTWYRIEMQMTLGTTTTNGAIAAAYYVGDSTSPVETAFTTNTANTTTTNASSFRFGKINTAPVYDIYYDDIAWNNGDATAIGPYTPGVPSAPTAASATASNGQAVVTFTTPSSNGSSAITSYTATSYPGSITSTLNSATAAPITVTGLTNGTAYTFTVRATNANGNSPESAPSAAVIPSTTPGAPTSISATAGNAQATISFSAPVSTGGSVITGYTATSSPGNLSASHSGAIASPITITGLTNGTAYTFTVRATNANGNSAASSTSNAVTPTALAGTLRQNTAEGMANGTVLASSQSGSGDAFNTVSTIGAPVREYATAQYLHGTKSYHVSGTTSDRLFIEYTGASATSSAARLYVRFVSLPNAAMDLVQIRNTQGSLNAGIGMNALGRLQVKDSAATLYTFTNALSLNTWYRIELQTTVHASAAAVAAAYYVEDATSPSETAFSTTTANTTSDNVSYMRFGKITQATTFETFYDSIAWNYGSSAPIGPYTAPGNVIPTANAGSDQAALEPYTSVVLSGTDSDSDGTVASRAWTQISGTTVVLSGTGASRSYVAPGTIMGTELVFGYQVTDNTGATSILDTVSHTILPVTERAVLGGQEVPVNPRAISAGQSLSWTTQNGSLVRRTAGVRLENANTVRYEDLYAPGDTIRSVMVKVPAGKILTLPPGEFTFSDFQNGSPYYAGLRVPSNVAGIAGSGIGQTILKMVSNTSTRNGLVPPQSSAPSTNPLYLMAAHGGTNQLFQHFTLEGTEQGHIYGGFALSASTTCTVQDILVKAVPGNHQAPPGETFCINVWQGSGMIGNRIEVDGRDANGNRISASPFGYNSHSNSTLTDCYFHHALASTFTYWQSHTCVTYNVRSEHNGTGVAGQTAHGINHERAYDITHYSPTVLPRTDTNGNYGYHMSWNSDLPEYVGYLRVHTPTFDTDSRLPGRFIVMSFASYRDVPNTQTTSPVMYDANGNPSAVLAWAH